MNVILIFELCNFLLLLLSCPTLSHSYFLSSSLYLSPPKHIYFYSFIRLWATSLTTAFCFIISRCKYVLDTCNLLWLHFPCLLHQLDASSLLVSRLSPYSDISLVTRVRPFLKVFEAQPCTELSTRIWNFLNLENVYLCPS